MENKTTNMIIKNGKIDKTIFVENYIHKEWLRLLKEYHNHSRKDRKEFICVYCPYKKNSEMWINEHQKEGCDKVVDSKGSPLKVKLYPPLINTVEGVYLTKGGNIMEYRAKANALLKPKNNHPLTTFALQPV
jgi:hypothetical protein